MRLEGSPAMLDVGDGPSFRGACPDPSRALPVARIFERFPFCLWRQYTRTAREGSLASLRWD